MISVALQLGSFAMADIFLSYSSKDRNKARDVASALESSGWTVWWDRKIAVAETFDKVISKELLSARCCVVLWSHSAVESNWVLDEADEAQRRNVLVPARLDGAEVPLG